MPSKYSTSTATPEISLAARPPETVNSAPNLPTHEYDWAVILVGLRIDYVSWIAPRRGRIRYSRFLNVLGVRAREAGRPAR
ncbi:MAG: hypothetical protein HKL82_03020 [Acidimicrobiaceae bacterium]|nr:hypothetical protein [Acidimicrobiaceae bacterium]